MNLTRHVLAVALLIASLATLSPARAGDGKAELDSSANARLFDSHFGRYGYFPQRSITSGGGGVRFSLPAQTKGVSQTGLSSRFSLAGDFEVSATYEVIALPPPQGRSGVSVGLAADTDGRGGNVSLVRGYWPDRGSGYALIRGRASADGPLQYELSFFASQSKKARLVLRREKAEAVALVAEVSGKPPHELGRVPFTEDTVRKLRLYADPGGSPTVLDARLGNLVVSAEEITAGIPRKEAQDWRGWWVAGAVVFVVAGLSLFAVRRNRQKARGL
jgi:hypothetical protein